MHYHEEDIGHLVRRSPYLKLSKPRGAEAFLAQASKTGKAFEKQLSEYPREQYEPLAFFYTCLHALGALNVEVVEDFMSDWRSIVWACHLVFLDPRPEYLDVLRRLDKNLPHNQWWVDLVLAHAEGRPVHTGHEEVARSLGVLRQQLLPLPRPTVQLRRAPSVEETAHMRREQTYLRELYKTAGSNAVREAMVGTLTAYYLQDHEQWSKGGCKPPPSLQASTS